MLKRARPELPEGCVSDLRLDALRTQELSQEESADVHRHLTSCDRCSRRQAALGEHAEALTLHLRPFLKPNQEHAPRSRASSLRSHARGLALSVALAACALFAVLRVLPDEAGLRTKGAGPELGFYVKRGELVFEGVAGQTVAPGDQLRFVVSAHGYAHVAVLSRGADGQVSAYFPAGPQAASVDPDRTGSALDGAVELDGSLAQETVYGVFCEAPFLLAPLLAELQRSAELVAADGCAVTSLPLRKALVP
jgi:hypothetical protein